MKASFVLLVLCAVALQQARAQYGGCFAHGTSYNPQTKTFCCKGNPYPAPANPNNMGCCGKWLVDKTTNLCCSNDAFPKGPNMKCCDKTYIDTTTQMCCDGEMRFKPEGVTLSCCGKKAYDPSLQVCCNQDLVMKADAQYNVACQPGNDADRASCPPPLSPGPPQGHQEPGQSSSQAPRPYPPQRFPPPPPGGQGFQPPPFPRNYRPPNPWLQ